MHAVSLLFSFLLSLSPHPSPRRLCVLAVLLASSCTTDSLPTNVCGNGARTGPEQCDDGNLADGDGCSRHCMLEDPCGCAEGGLFVCTETPVSTGLPANITVCCPSLVNPVTSGRVCHCKGQASASPYTEITDQCEEVDIDECRHNNGGCAPNAVCVNVDGLNATLVASLGAGRRCVCPAGLFGDGEAECKFQRLLAHLALSVRNLTEEGNFLSPAWIEAQVLQLGVDRAWYNASQVGSDIVAVSSRYLETLGGAMGSAPGGAARRRRLLASEFDHVTVVFEASDWDTLQQLVTAVNAEQVAVFLQNQTSGLNQVTVLQSTSTVVEDSPSSYTETVAVAPGFTIENITYDALAGHVWVVTGHFFAPPGVYHVLFATRGHAGHAPLEHECVSSPDACCLHRMAPDHYMGNFSDYVAAEVSPWCTGPGGTPNASATSSSAVLGQPPQTAWVDFAADSSGGPGAALDGSSAEETGPGTLRVQLSQTDVALRLSAAENLTNGTRYTFAVGMLFFRPLPVPSLFTAVAQAQLQVFASAGTVFTVSTNQDYSFLEFLDVVLYEIEYRPAPGTRHRLQFARVTFVLPAGMWADAAEGAVPRTSVETAAGAGVQVLSDGSAWTNACLSAENAADRDGSGLWDFSNGTRGLFELAGELPCALRDLSFCRASNSTEVLPGEETLFSIDVPLRGTLEPEETGPSYVFLRMMVRGLQNGTGVYQNDVFEALSQISTQTLVQEDRLLRLCTDPLSSVLKDTDFVGITLSVGVEMEPIDGIARDEVVFDDITNAPAYAEVNVLETGDVYKAVSIIDAMLTVVLKGSEPFFSAHEHLGYSAEVDSVVVVHVRSDPKHAQLKAMVQDATAYTQRVGAGGFMQVVLSPAFLRVCYDGLLQLDSSHDSALDCVVQHAIVDRQTDEDLTHEVSDNINDDLEWLLVLFGDTPYMRDMALEFARRTRERFSLNYRYRKAWWLVPSYAWPDTSSIGTVDRTFVFTAFAVSRGL